MCFDTLIFYNIFCLSVLCNAILDRMKHFFDILSAKEKKKGIIDCQCSTGSICESITSLSFCPITESIPTQIFSLKIGSNLVIRDRDCSLV